MKHLIKKYLDNSITDRHSVYPRVKRKWVNVVADLVTVTHGWYAYIEYGGSPKKLYRTPIMGFVTYVDPDVTNTNESVTTSPVGFDGREIEDAVAYTTPDNRMLDMDFFDMGAFNGVIYDKPEPDDPMFNKPWDASFSIDQSTALISDDISYSNLSPL